MRSAPAIAFDYRASPLLALAVGAGMLAAIVAPWLSRLPTGACGVASLSALVAGVASLARFERVAFPRIFALTDSPRGSGIGCANTDGAGLGTSELGR